MRQEEALACWIEFAACNDFGQNKPHKKPQAAYLTLAARLTAIYVCLRHLGIELNLMRNTD